MEGISKLIMLTQNQVEEDLMAHMVVAAEVVVVEEVDSEDEFKI